MLMFLEVSDMRPEEILICRIFEQAIEDYRDLKKRKLEGRDTGHGTEYSIRDIEKFFGSKWCNTLLEMIDSNLSGKDILGKIQAQCA